MAVCNLYLQQSFLANTIERHHALELRFDQALHAAGIETAWLLDVPTFAQSIPSMIWNNPNLTSVAPINFAAISQLETALHAENITTFNPRPLFCIAGCTMMDADKRPLYFDDDHLTLTGARQLEDMMRAIIDQFGVES